jgi:hypothetical protein
MDRPRSSLPNRRLAIRASASVLLISVAALVPANVAIGSPHAVPSAVYGLVSACYLWMGLLILERRPGNRVGPITYAIGVATAASIAIDAYVTHGSLGPELPATELVAWAYALGDGPLFAALAILVMLFPTGRLPSDRWRLVGLSTVALGVASAITTGLRPGPLPYHTWIDNPVGLTGSPTDDLVGPAQLLLAGPVLLALLAPLARWRRADCVERAQIKWIGASGLAIATSIGFYIVVFGGGYHIVGDLIVGMMLATFPVAVGIAITRYRLFEIDRILSRGVGWALVTASVAAIYLGTVLVLQGALGAVTQGDTLAVAASTMLVAGLFQPLRRRVQEAVDRHFYRSRQDAERTAAALAERLRNEVEFDAIARALVTTAGEALEPRRLDLWVRPRSGSRVART